MAFNGLVLSVSIMEKSVFKNLKVVDLILKLLLPAAHIHPAAPGTNTDQRKESILILNKVDLADPLVTRKWVGFYSQGNP